MESRETVFSIDMKNGINTLYVDLCEDGKYRVFIDEKKVACSGTKELAYQAAIQYLANK